MNVASVFDCKKAGPRALGSVARRRKPAATRGEDAAGGERSSGEDTSIDQSPQTKKFQRFLRRLDSSCAILFRRPTKRAAYHPLEHLKQLSRMRSLLCARGSAGATANWQHRPCQEKLVFGALNRIIEADESGQEWKQSHQRPDQGPTFGDCGGSNPSAEGDDAYRD